MTSDPSSSETSSPDLYNGEFGHGNNGGAPAPNGNNVLHEEANKLSNPQHQQPQLPHPHHNHHGMSNMHMPTMDNTDWRGRIPSGHPSPAIGYEQQQQQHSYFSQAPPNSNGPSAFSNSSAPTTPYGGPAASNGPRKYATGPSAIQQQAS